MVQGYYTLEEASALLGLPQEELKQKARSKELRSFQDRGTLHFRIQDIQELQRQRSSTSDPELSLGDASLPLPSAGPTTPRVGKTPDVPDVFDFEFDAAEPANPASGLLPGGSGSRKKTGGPKSGGRPASKPAEGSDSDVKLISDGSDMTFAVAGDSNVKLPGSGPKPPSGATRSSKLGIPALPPGAPRSSKVGIPAVPPSGAPRSSKVGIPAAPPSSATRARSGPATPRTPSKSPRPGSGPQPADSGVRLVPMDSDSDVRIVGTSADEIDLGGAPVASAADSSVRLDRVPPPPPPAGEQMMLTEEINLDEELKKQEEVLKGQTRPTTRVKPKSELKMPAPSPFELSEADADLPPALTGQQTAAEEGSSDYDLVPAEDGTVLQDASSDDFSLELSDDNQVLGADPGSSEKGLTGPTSGLSLNNPIDAGISLEDPPPTEGEDLDFDLSLEADATPRPGEEVAGSSEFELNLDSSSELEATGGASSEFDLSLDLGDASADPGGSSEFELSLDASSEEGSATLDSDSEFELNLEASGEGEASSDSSEFELTLDDSGEAPQVKAGGEEQEAFETDFEVPSLEESGVEGADTDLESSDFDLALDDSELAADEESGSQVVALDEEEAVETLDDGAEVDVEAEPEEDVAEVEAADEEVAEEEEPEEAAAGVREVVRESYLKPAPWGALPVVFMLPCVVVMVLVGLMGFELVQSAGGYKAPGPLTKAIGEMIGQKIK